MITSTSLWLGELQRSVAQARLPYLDLLVDATNLDFPLTERLAGLEQPILQSAILQHTPEHQIAQSGPWLLRLDHANVQQLQLG